MNSPSRLPTNDCGFTLIELLVVVTIIVALLTLLTPALDQAIYQAELAVCAGNVKGLVTTANLYTLDFKRYYPNRKQVRPTGDRAPTDFNRGGQDDRAPLEGYFTLNKVFNDPFVEPVDLVNTHAQSWVQGSYAMWFGFGYNAGGPHAGMFKLGDRFEWEGVRYNWLVSDHDLVGAGGGAHASHPDRDGIMQNLVLQDNAGSDAERTAIAQAGFRYTFSRWESLISGSIVVNFVAGAPRPGDRGLLDLNFGAADGSVIRSANVPAVPVPPGDDPVMHVPYHADDAAPDANLQLPRP
jgi:prepilin-type N-terminal cleavage/methylation domain-containing protein